MVRIIHLSDLHIGQNGRNETRRAAQICTFLCEHFAVPGPPPVYVLVTGDVVHSGAASQYREAHEVLDGLRTAGFVVLPVPGNHDYRVNGYDHDPTAPARFAEFARPFWGANAFPAVPCPDVPLGALAFPAVCKDSERVAFFGLDSADPGGDQGCAEGIVRMEQRARLGQQLQQCPDCFKVVFFHHHLFENEWFWHNLNEAEALRRVLVDNKVDLVLYGHEHESRVYFGRGGLPTTLMSGQVTEDDNGVLRFRVIEVDTAPSPPRIRVAVAEIPSAGRS